jgi:hypothetical protein
MEDAIVQNTLGFFDILWSIVLLFLLVAWIWVVISVLADVFRSRDMRGISKALWVLLIILIPWLGVLAYILIRGDRMQENQLQAVKQFEDAQRDYLRSVVGTSPATELEKLAALKEKGVLSEEEFAAQKARILNA